MNKLLDCIINKKSSQVPIWFMRQAGRYLPEFQKIRKENLDFIKLCLDSGLVVNITLQPLNRFDLDAAIIFSDILMIPYGLGQKVEFKKGTGPILGDLNFNVILNTKPNDFIEKLSPIYTKRYYFGTPAPIIDLESSLKRKDGEKYLKDLIPIMDELGIALIAFDGYQRPKGGEKSKGYRWGYYTNEIVNNYPDRFIPTTNGGTNKNWLKGKEGKKSFTHGMIK